MEVIEDTTKVRLELIEERVLTKDVEMQLAKEMGKRIMISNNKDKRRSDLLFYDKNGRLVHTISGELYKISYLISQDSKSAGVLYASKNSLPKTPRDSLVAYDSLGRRKWGIKQGDDGADLVLNNPGIFHLSADRLIAIQNHMRCIPTYKTKDGLKVLFFKDGKKVKEVVVPHPYIWQAGWSPDGEMFIISVPGRSAAGISKDDVIYAYDKNGNELWKYVAEGMHFTPVEWGNHKTLIITNSKILHATGKGYILLGKNGTLIENKIFNPPMSCDFLLSPNKEYVVGYDPINMFSLLLSNGKIIWRWRWETKDKQPLIRDCYFSKNSQMVAISGSSNEKRGNIFIFNILKGYNDGIIFERSVDRYGRSLKVYFTEKNEFKVISPILNKLYKIKITK
jgi:hypothetical protein